METNTHTYIQKVVYSIICDTSCEHLKKYPCGAEESKQQLQSERLISKTYQLQLHIFKNFFKNKKYYCSSLEVCKEVL